MKTVFITGMNRGLGKELFDQFIAKGYFVYGVLRDEDEHKKLSANLPGNAKLILADIADDKCISIIKDIVGDIPVHLLINNAGIGGSSCNLEDVTTDELNKLFNINCSGVLRVTKALSSNLLSTPNPVVINLNSRLGSITRQNNGDYKALQVSYAYRISKAAQNMLTSCLRSEFNGKIKFISLHPGTLKTAIAQKDASIEPAASATIIIDRWEKNKLNEGNGITELTGSTIEW
jgi:NAD(P)-dependent dehydrogenase (short-subunit alcohol dehydrogenase family)